MGIEKINCYYCLNYLGNFYSLSYFVTKCNNHEFEIEYCFENSILDSVAFLAAGKFSIRSYSYGDGFSYIFLNNKQHILPNYYLFTISPKEVLNKIEMMKVFI